MAGEPGTRDRLLLEREDAMTALADSLAAIERSVAGRASSSALSPVGRVYYDLSTLLCTPASLSQEVGLALGAQAGEVRIRDVVMTAGFNHLRRAAETPFNLVFEARP
jgi:hypothetical protein